MDSTRDYRARFKGPDLYGAKRLFCSLLYQGETRKVYENNCEGKKLKICHFLI